MMRMKKTSVLAVLSALAAVAVALTLVLVLRAGVQQTAASDSGLALPPQAPFSPSPPGVAVEPLPPVEQEPSPGVVEENSPALCDGCLSEPAVLDVVETYLRHLDFAYLHGEIWAQPFAGVNPDEALPKLPPGLVGAPEHNPFGISLVDTGRYPVETTWLVWIQTGWVPRHAIEQRIRTVTKTTVGEMRTKEHLNFAAVQAAMEEAAPRMPLTDDVILKSSGGDLPDIALSWPPIKEETYVAVDSRTGEIYPDGIFKLTSAGQMPPYPAHYESVLDATQDRAARWLRGGGSELGNL